MEVAATPEVAELDVEVAREEDVLGFDVSVGDSGSMDGFEG